MPEYVPTPQDIEDFRQQCVNQARKALRLRDERDRLEEQESKAQGGSGPTFRAAHAVYLLAAVAAIGIDILLLSPTAEFVVGRAFPDHPSLAFAAKLVFPVFVVLLELALAMRIYESRENVQDARHDVRGRARRDYRFWWMLGAAFVCFVPILALSTQLSELAAKVAAPGQINGYTKASLLGKAIGISILAFVAHAMFVYGGRYIVESKSMLLRYLSSSREAQQRQASEAFEEQRGTVLDTFADYHQALRGYNEANPDQPIPAGPFPNEVRELINSGYGREILETPSDGPSGTGRSGNGRPAPSGRPAGDGAASDNFSGGHPTSDRDRAGNHRTDTPNGDPGSERSGPSRSGSGEDSGTGEDEGNGSPEGLREQYDQSRRDDEDGRLSP
jgi:hypothetical protein